MKKIYTVYKTVNLLSSEYYIGVHSTENPYDGYLGSGLKLLKEVEKIGRENFRKYILFTFDIPDLAFQKEVALLKDCLLDPLCYNEATGGRGLRVGQISPKCIERLRKNSEILKSQPYPESSKKKLSKIFTGTIFINDGNKATRWSGDRPLPIGWVKGRFKNKKKRQYNQEYLNFLSSEEHRQTMSVKGKIFWSSEERRKQCSVRQKKVWDSRPKDWSFNLTTEEKRKITDPARQASKTKRLLEQKFRVCFYYFTSFPASLKSSMSLALCSQKCYLAVRSLGIYKNET